MQASEDLRSIRVNKLNKLLERGVNPYPTTFNHNAIKTILVEPTKFTAVPISFAGRIISFREHGKTIFANIKDQNDQIQIYFKRDVMGIDQFELLSLLDIGDIIGITGTTFTTHRNEITVLVNSFQLLAKALRPLPDKWHGLNDIETRYRKRYLDILSNPVTKDILIKRSKIISTIRQFLDERGFLEVETPTLQPLYGGTNARPFMTYHNELDANLYLKISDELYLKRIVVGGIEKVYEIDKDFRNEGVDTTHNPEFTMLECYWAYVDYNEMMNLTEELYEYVALQVLGTTQVTWNNISLELKRPWRRISMANAIKEYLNINVEALSDEELLRKVKEQHNESISLSTSRGLLIAKLFEGVEDKLIQPTFVIDFPKETTALCKPKSNNPDIIERFEPYIAGKEIGNAYSELNDPILQRKYLEEQVKAKAAGDEEAHPLDEDFIECMEYGMPPMGGVGLGIDRMVMFLTGATSIRDVILFPTLKPTED